MSASSGNPVEPIWPKQRNLDRYNLLAGFNIAEMLSVGGLWIDVGPGEDADPMRALVGQPGVALKAIGPHLRRLPNEIAFTTGLVPDDAIFLKENRGKARLVTDIFGAVSYCDNPVHALIYEGLLLGAGGTCIAFTELERFGDLKTWSRITEFFRTRLGQRISLQSVCVFGDASRRFSTELRVRFDCEDASSADWSDLLGAADREIGVALPSSTLWISSDGNAKICRVDYTSQQ